jgi:histidine kinase
MVLLLIIALIAFSYICNIVTFRYSELKLWLLLMLFLISWQSIFNQGVASTLLYFFDILHPLNSFLLVYSSLSIIFLGEKIGEELLSVSFVLTLITISSYLLSPSIFLFLSLFASFFLNLVPLILLILYHKELKSKLKYQRRNLWILALILPLSYFFLYINTTGSGVTNLVWYLEILGILAFLHFKTIISSLQKKVSELKLSYIKAFSRLFLLVMFLLVGIFIIFRLDLNTSFLVLNIILLLFGICSEELIRLFRSSEMLDSRDYVKVLFLKRNRMVKNLLANEDTEQQFSEFLHNEILQNVMAIKNFNKYSSNQAFGEQINLVTEELVQRIRERMDYYQPMVETDEQLDIQYQGLINRIVKRYHAENEVVTQFPAHFRLLSPYDKIAYRLVEELATNAVKYASGGRISLKIDVHDDAIFIISENDCIQKEKSLGYGLKNMSNKISVLGGQMQIFENNKKFRVEITLPIDKELCYENFVN